MTVWIGSTPSVIISSADMAKQILRVHDQQTSDRPTVLRLVSIFNDLQDIAFSPANQSWKEQRSLALLHLLSPKQLRLWESSRQAEIDRMVAAMVKEGRGAEEFTLTLHPFLSRATLNNILSACCGRSYLYDDLLCIDIESRVPASTGGEMGQQQQHEQEEGEDAGGGERMGGAGRAKKQECVGQPHGVPVSQQAKAVGDFEVRRVVGIVDELFLLAGSFNIADFIPWLSWLDPKHMEERARKTAAEWKAFSDALVDERRAQLAQVASAGEGSPDLTPSIGSEKMTFLDFLLQHEGEGGGKGKVSKREIYLLLLDMVMAGTDTSSRTTEWGLAELARHPHVLKRLQAEVDEWYEREEGGGGKEGEGRNVEGVAQHVSNLPYLHAVLSEIYRLHPVATLLVPHMTNASIAVEGYEIPAKTIIQVNAWAIHRDPTAWENPTEFDPARFLPPNKPVDVKGRDFRVIPFGTGRRGCPGLHLGYDLVARMIAGVVREFDLLPEEEGKEIDMSEEYGLTTGMKAPLRVRLHRRSEART